MAAACVTVNSRAFPRCGAAPMGCPSRPAADQQDNDDVRSSPANAKRDDARHRDEGESKPGACQLPACRDSAGHRAARFRSSRRIRAYPGQLAWRESPPAARAPAPPGGPARGRRDRLHIARQWQVVISPISPTAQAPVRATCARSPPPAFVPGPRIGDADVKRTHRPQQLRRAFLRRFLLFPGLGTRLPLQARCPGARPRRRSARRSRRDGSEVGTSARRRRGKRSSSPKMSTASRVAPHCRRGLRHAASRILAQVVVDHVAAVIVHEPGRWSARGGIYQRKRASAMPTLPRSPFNTAGASL